MKILQLTKIKKMVRVKILLSKLHSKNLLITMSTAISHQSSNPVCLPRQILLTSEYNMKIKQSVFIILNMLILYYQYL